MIKFKNYVCPDTLEEAYELCTNKRNVVLGGMLWLKMNHRTYNTAIDLKKLGLDTITEDEDNYYIGAMVTLRTLETHEELNSFTKDAMKHAVEHLIGVQFRNCATIGGSIAGRFGFSDVLTLFMAMDAKVELYHGGIISITELLDYPRPLGDILVRVIVPKNLCGVVYMSQRNSATDFPALTCAAAKTDSGYRVVIGARPAIAKLHLDENGLLKDGVTEETANAFGEYVSNHTSFGDNTICGGAYRQRICKVLVRRSLLQLDLQCKEAKEVSSHGN